MKKEDKYGNFRTMGRMCFSWMIPGVEHWLEKMAAEGWELYDVSNVVYYFKRCDPKTCRYYIATSELGSDSEVASVKELVAKGAVAFGDGSHRFGGPDYVLRMEEGNYPKHLDQYYRERNTRIIGSFLNMLFAFGIFAVCLSAYFGLYAKDYMSLFFCDLFLLLLAGVFGGFLLTFVLKCRKLGQPYRFRQYK